MKIKKWLSCVLIIGMLLGEILVSGNTAEAAAGSWKKDSGGWYYSYSNGGYAKNTWIKSGGKWYYLNSKGYMQTGWKKISGKWYFFAGSGVMQTGWKKLSGRWYFFNKNGVMLTGTWRIDGTKYTFNSDGTLVEKKSLFSLEPYTVTPVHSLGAYPFAEEINERDVYSRTYARAFRACMIPADGERSMTYRISKKYKKFSFVLAVSESSKGCPYSGSLYIYADGRLVVRRDNISSTHSAENITVNVSGVRDLKIEMYAGNNGAWMPASSTSVLMCNPTLIR